MRVQTVEVDPEIYAMHVNATGFKFPEGTISRCGNSECEPGKWHFLPSQIQERARTVQAASIFREISIRPSILRRLVYPYVEACIRCTVSYDSAMEAYHALRAFEMPEPFSEEKAARFVSFCESKDFHLEDFDRNSAKVLREFFQ